LGEFCTRGTYRDRPQSRSSRPTWPPTGPTRVLLPCPTLCVAYKYPADFRIAELVEVNWQVALTGVITPRARITPTFVGGTTITYATLHKSDDTLRKDVGLPRHPRLAT
jgi:NAD-dependent DNA ligase OB-fold domain